MVRSGEVVEVHGGLATVVFDRPDACANCHGCLGKQCARVDIEVSAKVGDMVEVMMPDQSVLKASAVAYLLPVIMLLAGMFFADALHAPLSVSISKDLFTALAAFLFLAAGLFLVRLIDRGLSSKEQWKPVVLSVYKKEERG